MARWALIASVNFQFLKKLGFWAALMGVPLGIKTLLRMRQVPVFDAGGRTTRLKDALPAPAAA